MSDVNDLPVANVWHFTPSVWRPDVDSYASRPRCFSASSIWNSDVSKLRPTLAQDSKWIESSIMTMPLIRGDMKRMNGDESGCWPTDLTQARNRTKYFAWCIPTRRNYGALR